MQVEETEILKMEPISRGRTDLRRKKPRQLAVINECCTGCSGSPVCVQYCPVEACMFWIPDEDHPPFGRIEIDKVLCIGCAKCTSKGPDGMFLDGCPWNAIDMVETAEWESAHATTLPNAPERDPSDWNTVPVAYV